MNEITVNHTNIIIRKALCDVAKYYFTTGNIKFSIYIVVRMKIKVFESIFIKLSILTYVAYGRIPNMRLCGDESCKGKYDKTKLLYRD